MLNVSYGLVKINESPATSVVIHHYRVPTPFHNSALGPSSYQKTLQRGGGAEGFRPIYYFVIHILGAASMESIKISPLTDLKPETTRPEFSEHLVRSINRS